MVQRMLALLAALCLVAFAPSALSEGGMDEGPLMFGAFEAEDLNGGENVTEAIFADAKITLVNYWATWCGPCISELPDLAILSERTGGDVQVVSVLLDAVDMDGNRDEDAIEAMESLVQEAGAGYPVLMPEGDFLVALGSVVQYIPTTFVVDETGEIHAMLTSARSFEQWLAVAQDAAREAYGDAVQITAQ